MKKSWLPIQIHWIQTVTMTLCWMAKKSVYMAPILFRMIPMVTDSPMPKKCSSSEVIHWFSMRMRMPMLGIGSKTAMTAMRRFIRGCQKFSMELMTIAMICGMRDSTSPILTMTISSMVQTHSYRMQMRMKMAGTGSKIATIQILGFIL